MAKLLVVMSEKLQDPIIRSKFDIKLKNCYETLRDELNTTNEPKEVQVVNDLLDKALIKTSEEVMGKRSTSKQPRWVSSKTLDLIQKQNEVRRLARRG